MAHLPGSLPARQMTSPGCSSSISGFTAYFCTTEGSGDVFIWMNTSRCYSVLSSRSVHVAHTWLCVWSALCWDQTSPFLFSMRCSAYVLLTDANLPKTQEEINAVQLSWRIKIYRKHHSSKTQAYKSALLNFLCWLPWRRVRLHPKCGPVIHEESTGRDLWVNTEPKSEELWLHICLHWTGSFIHIVFKNQQSEWDKQACRRSWRVWSGRHSWRQSTGIIL